MLSGKYIRKLTAKGEIEGSLERLDKLTQEEAQMASAEQLKKTHGVDNRVRGVEGQVQDIRGDVQDVGKKVHDVDNRVQVIDNSVRGVGDKLDQSNRSSSL